MRLPPAPAGPGPKKKIVSSARGLSRLMGQTFLVERSIPSPRIFPVRPNSAAAGRRQAPAQGTEARGAKYRDISSAVEKKESSGWRGLREEGTAPGRLIHGGG